MDTPPRPDSFEAPKQKATNTWWIAGGIGIALLVATVVGGIAVAPEVPANPAAAQALEPLSPEDVVSAMNAAGIQCINPTSLTLDNPKPTIRAATCSMHQENGEWSGLVKVMTSEVGSDELYDYEVTFYQDSGNAAVVIFPIQMVRGDRWLVSGMRQETAMRVAAALNGQIASING